MAINVHSTNVSSHNWSRHEMLSWINKEMQAEFTKIEELCTGAAYCQLMEMMFPNTVTMKRIKFRANQEHEFVHNFKILQASFEKATVRKEIPIERLIKGRFQDNFEFLQWFRKFFNANYHGSGYNALSAREGAPMGYGPSTLLSGSCSSRTSRTAWTTGAVERSRTFVAEKAPDASDQLSMPIKSTDEIKRIGQERDFYSSKLIRIKELCVANLHINNPLISKIMKIIDDTAGVFETYQNIAVTSPRLG